MPVGLQVINDSGSVQIDATYFNYTLAQKITVTTTQRTVGYQVQAVARITFTGQKIVAAKLENSQWVGRLPGNFGSDGTQIVDFAVWGGSSSSIGVGGPVPNGTPVTFYLFDLPVHTGTFGLQVFSDTGELVFSSESRYMRVIGHWVSPVNPVSINTSFSLLSDVQCAVVMGRYSGKFNETWMSQDKWMYENYEHLVVAKNGANCVARATTYYRYDFPSPTGSTYNENLWDTALLVLDVTGY